MLLTAIASTWLKAKPVQSQQLLVAQKYPLKKAQQLEITGYQIEGEHLKIQLSKPLAGWVECYVFANDVQVDGQPKAGEIRLKVAFASQVARTEEPSNLPGSTQNRMCNSSSNFMVARYLGAKIASDDDFFRLVSRYGDTTDHAAVSKALDSLGVKSTWCVDLGFEDLDNSLEAGLPVVLGILHRGTLEAPRGGHMIVAIGRTKDKDYIFNDPYGSLMDAGGGYTGAVNNGSGAVYPRSVLQRRWLTDGDRAGWGRLFLG
jgi:Peptidase_C39 like family